MPYDQEPETPISREQAVGSVRAFIDERAGAGVLMANAFTGLELVDGVLTATWSETSVGQPKSDILLELSPYENLAVWLGTPLSFDNEQGRQIRQHVHTVSVIGPFGVGSMGVRDLYERATGLGHD